MSPELVALGVILLMFVSGYLWGRSGCQIKEVSVHQIGYAIFVEVNGRLVYRGRIEDDELVEEGSDDATA